MTWLLIIAISALACTALFYEMWMRRVSLGWPVAEAKLDLNEVAKTRRRYLVRLRYSYFVAGSLYGGTWLKSFRTEMEAVRLKTSLDELLVLVRYDPKRPERSWFDPYRDSRIEKMSRL